MDFEIFLSNKGGKQWQTFWTIYEWNFIIFWTFEGFSHQTKEENNWICFIWEEKWCEFHMFIDILLHLGVKLACYMHLCLNYTKITSFGRGFHTFYGLSNILLQFGSKIRNIFWLFLKKEGKIKAWTKDPSQATSPAVISPSQACELELRPSEPASSAAEQSSPVVT